MLNISYFRLCTLSGIYLTGHADFFKRYLQAKEAMEALGGSGAHLEGTFLNAKTLGGNLQSSPSSFSDTAAMDGTSPLGSFLPPRPKQHLGGKREAFPEAGDIMYLQREFLLEDEICTLCGAQISQNENFQEKSRWTHHTATGFHRMSCILMRLVEMFYTGRSLESITEEWVTAAVHHGPYYMCQPLIDHEGDLNVTMAYLRKALLFLKKQGVLKASLGGRGHDFDQVEWVGDLALPPMIQEVTQAIFDHESPRSVAPLMGPFMGFLCSNIILEKAFDFMQFERLFDGSKDMDLNAEKSKADVVEALVGELEMFMWASEVDVSCDVVPVPTSMEMQSLLALVNHCRYMISAGVVFAFVLPALARMVPLVVRVQTQLRGYAQVPRKWPRAPEGRPKWRPYAQHAPRSPPGYPHHIIVPAACAVHGGEIPEVTAPLEFHDAAQPVRLKRVVDRLKEKPQDHCIRMQQAAKRAKELSPFQSQTGSREVGSGYLAQPVWPFLRPHV